MARVYREIHSSRLRQPERVDDGNDALVEGMTFIERLVYMIGGAIVGLLALRFILSLLGANPANAFANFIYSVSGIFAAPFFGLFSYQTRFGIARFEYETLVALVVYALLTWFIVRLMQLGRSYD